MKIIECVPNFSEGKDLAKIRDITTVIEAVPGITVLDVDPGADTNRTVVTFIGSPESVAEAAFLAIKRASELIDMSVHSGEHPRMGATDVCPFVPVEGVTMEDCVALAHAVGKRVGEQLSIPVYFYEEAARKENRRNLATVRKGEYEGLAEKLKDPQWKPDCGPDRFNAKSGATIIGAREFLIAYNISLNTSYTKYATDIAFELRRKGRVARSGNIHPFYFRGDILFYKEKQFPCGNCDYVASDEKELHSHYRTEHDIDFTMLCEERGYECNNLVGQKVLRAGMFDHCKAIGWYVDQYKRAQISINLTNYKITPPHVVLEKARELAAQRGLVVTGSEIVGVIPYAALYQAGRYYLQNQKRSVGIPGSDVLRTAVQSMGLSDVSPFEIEKKVIGLPKHASNALVMMKVKDFTDEVSRDTPAPGGGSIAALCGSLGAALASMVANLSFEKSNAGTTMTSIATQCQKIKDELLTAVDEDTNAFNAFLEALRLPKNTPEEIKIRAKKMQEGLKTAITVPYRTAEASYEAMIQCKEAVINGNPNSITDAAVGSQIAFTGVRGGVWNVLINLKDIKDSDYRQQMQHQCGTLMKKASDLLNEIVDHVNNTLNSMIAEKANK